MIVIKVGLEQQHQASTAVHPARAVRRRPSAATGRRSERLLKAGVTVVVIIPRQVKNAQSRYGPAGEKDDPFDAYASVLPFPWTGS